MAAMLGMRAFALAADRAGGGVYCGADGVFVADVPLLKHSGAPGEWSVRPTAELNDELTARYRLPVDIAAKANALALIVNALNRGDLAMAAIATVQMQLPDPPLPTKRIETADEILQRTIELDRSGLLKYGVWDPAKHPRADMPPNPGWFAPTGEQAEATTVVPVADQRTAASSGRLAEASDAEEVSAARQSATDALPPGIRNTLAQLSEDSSSTALAPSDRHLTGGEVALLQSVYGPNIDTNSVLVRSQYYAWYHQLFVPGALMTPDGNIYLGNLNVPDFSLSKDVTVKSLLVHEFMHVLQLRSGVDVKAEAADLLFGTPEKPGYGPSYDTKAYQYDLRNVKSFEDLNIEQQAALIQDYFLVQQGSPPLHNANGDTDTARYLNAIPESIVPRSSPMVPLPHPRPTNPLHPGPRDRDGLH